MLWETKGKQDMKKSGILGIKVQVAVLNGVVRVDLIKKLRTEQRHCRRRAS